MRNAVDGGVNGRENADSSRRESLGELCVAGYDVKRACRLKGKDEWGQSRGPEKMDVGGCKKDGIACHLCSGGWM